MPQRLLGLALLVLLVGQLSGCAGRPMAPASGSAAPPVAGDLSRLGELLADLAERLSPGIVQISAQTPSGGSQTEVEPRPRRGLGSGFIIDPTGIIVTSAHVLGGASSAEVRLADGRWLAANVLGRDDRADLAVLRVAGVRHFPALRLGDSSRTRVGQFALALGHPFGLERAVSFGIVSRKGALSADAPDIGLIQTDAAINPGNSGGPLVNMAGEVIGVNSHAARNRSLGLATPSNVVKQLLPRLGLTLRHDPDRH